MLIPLIWLLYACIAVCIYFVSKLFYSSIKLKRARSKWEQQMGCRPAKRMHFRIPFLGLDFIWDNVKHVQNHTLLRWKMDTFESLQANTFQAGFTGQTTFFTNEPENLKSAMSLDFKSWGVGEGRQRLLTPFLGHGIFTSDGEEWQHSRALLRPCFTRSQIGDITILEKHFQNLLERLPPTGSTVNLEKYFFSLTIDVATDFLFGASTNSLASNIPSAKTEEFVEAFSYCQTPFREGDGTIFTFLGLFLPNRKFKKSCKIVKEYGDYLMERGSAEMNEDEPDRYVFLHELKSQTSDKIKIRSELLNILLAGRDTTASLLVNVFFELARCPEICRRLRDEIGTLDGDQPSFEQLKDMKYLRAILNEALRLYPVVPDNGRQALCDTVLPRGGGEDGMSPIAVMSGDYMSWNLYALHRRKDFFGEDAELFRPERWLDHGDEKGLRVGWEYLPFNGGPRICIGQQFALMEASYITVRLLQEFPILESRDSGPWREKLSLTCTKLGGCRVSFGRES